RLASGTKLPIWISQVEPFSSCLNRRSGPLMRCLCRPAREPLIHQGTDVSGRFSPGKSERIAAKRSIMSLGGTERRIGAVGNISLLGDKVPRRSSRGIVKALVSRGAEDSQMTFEGGCYCKKIRYIAEGEPRLKAQCHCRECQYITGGAPNFFMLMPPEGFRYVSG